MHTNHSRHLDRPQHIMPSPHTAPRQRHTPAVENDAQHTHKKPPTLPAPMPDAAAASNRASSSSAATPAPANEPSTHSSPSHTLRHHAPRVGPPPASDAVPDRPTTRATPRSAASLPQQPPHMQCTHDAQKSVWKPTGPRQCYLRLTARHRPAAGTVTARSEGTPEGALPWPRQIKSCAHCFPCLHVGATVQQQLHSRIVAVLSSPHDRRPAVL